MVKKIVGDLHALKNDITTELGFTKDSVKINPVTGHIKIKVGLILVTPAGWNTVPLGLAWKGWQADIKLSGIPCG